MLVDILDHEGVETAIIFCNRKTEVRDLCQSLRKDGFDAGQIHGDMDQSSRLAELDRFKSGELNILCASDVAARGLDIKGVSHVINYDIPWHPDDYVHRIGRTGRAGATGVAITFVTRSDSEHVENIETLTGTKIPVRDSKSKRPAKRQKDENASKAHSKKDQGNKKKSGSKSEDRKHKAKKDNRKPANSPKEAKSEPVDSEKEDDGWNGPMPGFLDAKFDR